jgi:hypothetical protein
MFILRMLPLDRGLVAPIEKQTERMRKLATGGNGALFTVNEVLLRKYVSVILLKRVISWLLHQLKYLHV